MKAPLIVINKKKKTIIKKNPYQIKKIFYNKIYYLKKLYKIFLDYKSYF
jgi:hypothetical protein